MCGAPSAVSASARLMSALSNAVIAILNELGLTEIAETLNTLADKLFDWTIKKVTTKSMDEWKAIFEQRVSANLFGQQTYNKIMQEMQAVPPQGAYKHNIVDSNINAPLYNSIIASKLVFLNSAGLNTVLTRGGKNPGITQGAYIPQGLTSIDKSGGTINGPFGVIFTQLSAQLFRTYNTNTSAAATSNVQTATLSDVIKTLSVTIHTKGNRGAGTDADIFFGIRLSSGVTQEWMMDKSNYNDFEQNDTDEYVFNINDSRYEKNKVQSVWIRMGNHHGVGNDWDCDWMKIKINGLDVLNKSVNKNFSRENEKWEVGVNGFK